MLDKFLIGTRGSKLAMWQAHHVVSLLNAAYPDIPCEIIVMSTRGDRILDKSLPSIGGKGLFTEELEKALLEGEVDCAVHSLKDLPTENPPRLQVAAVPQRAPVADVLISKNGLTLAELPEGAIIGTSSTRRAAQLLKQRPDLQIKDIRGNVPTRIDKVKNGEYDASVLAQAGVERLELMEHVTEILPLELMLPAPGQGAIGIQAREDKAHWFEKLIDNETLLAVTAERVFLQVLGGGCAVPVAAYAHIEDGTLHFQGRVSGFDGKQHIDIVRQAPASLESAVELGQQAAQVARDNGAAELLES